MNKNLEKIVGIGLLAGWTLGNVYNAIRGAEWTSELFSEGNNAMGAAIGIFSGLSVVMAAWPYASYYMDKLKAGYSTKG